MPQLIVEAGEQHRVGVHRSRLVRFSHFMAKLVTRLEALGSASMRFTCFSSAPGLVKPFAAASVSSSSSGPVFQRKKESREASSRSVRANSVSGAVAFRPANRAIEELGADQNRRHDLLDALIEGSAVLDVRLRRTASGGSCLPR